MVNRPSPIYLTDNISSLNCVAFLSFQCHWGGKEGGSTRYKNVYKGSMDEFQKNVLAKTLRFRANIKKYVKTLHKV